jgi:YesN/AraC family two-component response regulator
MFYRLNPNLLPKICLLNTATIQPPYIHQLRRAGEYIMYIIKDGEMYLTENNLMYHLIPGDIILLDPEFTHEGVKTSYCEYYYIHFKHDDMKRELLKDVTMEENAWANIRNQALSSNSFSYELYETEKLLLPKYFHFLNQSSFIQLLYLLSHAVEENKTQLENYKIKCSCKVLEIMIEIERNYVSSKTEATRQGAAKAVSKVQEILSFINLEYPSSISSQTIEERFTCNFDYINRIFKRITGSTIFSYLNRVRIDHAKILILTTSLKMTEVAEQVGYLDIYYFSKVFKKHTGVSPTVYGRGM